MIHNALNGDSKMAQLVARFDDIEEIYDGMTLLDEKLIQQDQISIINQRSERIMKVSIFYSWQSDLPSKTNRYFIEEAIKKSLKEINKGNKIIACIDRDTKDELGSPDIRASIFQKINHSKLFVCDISLNENKVPNPNVLIELGYAIKAIGWSKISCLFNTQTGNIEDLPFDINHNRVTPYKPDSLGEKKRISEIISININDLFRKGKLYNPIEDHLKKKIDYIFLQIARNLINIFDFEKAVNFSKRLAELDNFSVEEMAYQLSKTQTLGFYYLLNYEESQINLENLLNQLMSCNYFLDGWREAVINLIDWLDMWNNTIDSHFSPNLFKTAFDSIYAIKDMHAENPQNPPESVMLLKHLKNEQYSVVQSGSLSKFNYKLAEKIVCIQDCYGYIIAKRIKEFLAHLDFWLEESGSEIILDPHYYVIHQK